MPVEISSPLRSQHQRLFKLTLPVQGAGDLLLDAFSGAEGLCEDFQFKLALISDVSDIELKAAMTQAARIEIALADGGSRFIHGHVLGFANTGSDGHRCRYAAVLGPWFSLLERRVDTRIFQDQTIEDVVRQVFSLHASLANYEFRLTTPLKPRSYLTQYRESDNEFVKRILEEEGLFYYFEHTPDTHVMIITDDSTRLLQLPEQPVIRFHRTGVTEWADSIFLWAGERSFLPGRVSMQTFDYRQPANRLPVSMSGLIDQGEAPAYEVYDYAGQYTYGNYEEGDAFIRRHFEALNVDAKVFIGASNCRVLRPGYAFTLTQHYLHDSDCLEDRRFLIVRVEHEGHNNYRGQVASYHNNIRCIRQKVPYRPRLATPRPQIIGPQTAIVVGPPGEEIYTDELGRVKVQFHWDRQGDFNDKSSCWVRVVQAGASGGFGAIQLPRVGDEVVVSFMDGNPDRPLVTGSLYNSMNTPPWPLPANKTQSGFLTRSLKGDGGTANFLRFEDKPGQEQLSLHAERNMDTEIEVDEAHTVGNNRRIAVGGTHTEVIKQDAAVRVEEGSFTLEVDQRFIQISASQYILLKVGNSSIALTPEAIKLQGEIIVTTSTGQTTITGKAVQIND
ncbi:type VI secretion system tip protein TssI/VgrG [Pseudomonas massiliensis]|uniref:type VI secretion system tip protein TssI/VgrG n=1 Tax=Pseudomonas massiliensis TaxID=522492 RepID=UPI000590B76D|nr:type VI secretion system tip protein TssI/VgrG [Pseudomonas massiliensis]